MDRGAATDEDNEERISGGDNGNALGLSMDFGATTADFRCCCEDAAIFNLAAYPFTGGGEDRCCEGLVGYKAGNSFSDNCGVCNGALFGLSTDFS